MCILNGNSLKVLIPINQRQYDNNTVMNKTLQYKNKVLKISKKPLKYAILFTKL